MTDLRRQRRNRDRRVVAEVQHRDRENEGEVEPVGDVDVRLLAAPERAEEDQKIGDPDDGQPEIDVPFRLGVFLALGDAEQVAGAGEHDEHLIAEHDEPRREVAGEAGAAGALHDVERGGEQHVAAEGEDHRRGVQRPQTAEVEPGRDVQPGIGEFEGDVDAHRHARHAPEQRREGAEFDRSEIVVGLAVDLERRLRRPRRIALEDGEDARRGGDDAKRHMKRVSRFDGLGGGIKASQGQDSQHRRQPDFAAAHRLSRRDRLHVKPPAPIGKSPPDTGRRPFARLDSGQARGRIPAPPLVMRFSFGVRVRLPRHTAHERCGGRPPRSRTYAELQENLCSAPMRQSRAQGRSCDGVSQG